MFRSCGRWPALPHPATCDPVSAHSDRPHQKSVWGGAASNHALSNQQRRGNCPRESYPDQYRARMGLRDDAKFHAHPKSCPAMSAAYPRPLSWIYPDTENGHTMASLNSFTLAPDRLSRSHAKGPSRRLDVTEYNPALHANRRPDKACPKPSYAKAGS